MKIILKTFRNPFVKWIIVPFVLLLLWFGMTVFYVSNKFGFGSIYFPFDNLDQVKYTELLKGEKVGSTFIAPENNLGIISVRFNTFARINSDVVNFRLKEKNKRDLLYTHSYKVDQFQPDQLFTFGFPIQVDSKGKEYEFEIESLKGKARDAIAISKNKPVFVTQHQFSKQQIISSHDSLFSYLRMKTFNAFSNIDFVINSWIYLSPLIIYLINIFLPIVLHRKIALNGFFAMLVLITINILINILLGSLLDNSILFITILIWISINVFSRIEGKVSYIIAIFILSLAFVLMLIGYESQAQKAATWTYFFLLSGVLLQAKEILLKSKNMVTYEKLFDNIFQKTK